MCEPGVGEIVTCTSQNAGRCLLASAATGVTDTIFASPSMAFAERSPQASCASEVAASAAAPKTHASEAERNRISSQRIVAPLSTELARRVSHGPLIRSKERRARRTAVDGRRAPGRCLVRDAPLGILACVPIYEYKCRKCKKRFEELV